MLIIYNNSIQSVINNLSNFYHMCTTFLFHFQKLLITFYLFSQTSSSLWTIITCHYQWYYDIRSGRGNESSSTTSCLTTGYINTHFSSNDGNLYICFVMVAIVMIDDTLFVLRMSMVQLNFDYDNFVSLSWAWHHSCNFFGESYISNILWFLVAVTA